MISRLGWLVTIVSTNPVVYQFSLFMRWIKKLPVILIGFHHVSPASRGGQVLSPAPWCGMISHQCQVEVPRFPGLSDNSVAQLQPIIIFANLSCYFTRTWGLLHFWTNKQIIMRLFKENRGSFRSGHRRGGSCLVLHAEGTHDGWFTIHIYEHMIYIYLHNHITH